MMRKLRLLFHRLTFSYRYYRGIEDSVELLSHAGRKLAERI